MQIKEDKYTPSHSKTIKVLGKGSDIRLDMQLSFNSNQTNLGASVVGTVVDSNNKPIQGAIIKLMDANLQPLTNAMTDTNGNYSINSIPFSNMYTMLATAQGKLLSQATPFTLSTGQTSTINFTLQTDSNATSGAISGSLQDVNSTAISGAIILLYSIINNTNSLIAITYTDTSGIFVFSDLSPGTYSITVNALGYLQSQLSTSVQNGIITTLSKTLSVNPQAPDGIVSGIISDSLNNKVAGADVILYNISSTNTLTPVSFTTTNSAGIYTFINVPSGNYLIKSNQSEIVTVNASTPTNTLTLPTDTTSYSSSTLPTSIYDIALGILSGGAAVNSVNYAGWIGGPSDGSSTLTVNVISSAIYNLIVKYIGPDINRPLKVDINGVNTGTIYSLPPTAGWTVNDTLSFTIPVTLNTGVNTIKFHGDGTNYSQNLGTLTVLAQVPNPIVSYNMNKVFNGTTDYLDISRDLYKIQNLASGAIVIKFKSTSTLPSQSIFAMSDSTNLATYLSIMLSTGKLRYEVKQNGTQNFAYSTTTSVNDGNVHTALISVGSRGIEIYIDGVNIYSVSTSNTFFSNVNGENTLNIGRLLNNSTTGQWYFNGNIEYIDIYSSELTVAQAQTVSLNNYKVIPALQANTYNTLAGTLSSGATIDGATSFTGLLGGPTDGSSTVVINVPSSGAYNLAVKYIGPDIDRPLKVDVNGTTIGVYTLGKTYGWTVDLALTYNIVTNLVTGNNTIKFHGDGTNFTPNLGLFTVTSVTSTFNISSAVLNNGAKVDTTGYVINTGGTTNGSSILTVTVPFSGIYELKVNYRNVGTEKPLNIDINSANTGATYTLPINTNGIFTTTIVMSEGRNRIKFYGEKATNYTGAYAPDLLSCTLSLTKVIEKNKPISYSKDYFISNGQLFNSATIASDNYVISQGGPLKGYSIVTVSVPYYGTYNLVLTRKNSTIRPLNIDINGINTGTTYYVPAGTGMKYIVYNIVFNQGTNTIKFYGDSSDSYTPDLLTVNVLYTSASLPKNTSVTYDVTSATLINGSTISSGYSVSNGGPNNGYTLFNVKVLNAGVYNLSLIYRHSTTTGRPLNIDVNNINTGTLYMLPAADPGTFKLKINLDLGMNTIKFYGDSQGNYTPDIKALTLDLVTPVPCPADNYLTLNSSTIPNIYQLRNIDLKYGMFLHFSINTFVDLEWSDGTIDPIKFAPPYYDIDRWVELIWESGMNFIILITKHHDGMSLKDSIYSDYDIAASSTTYFNEIKAVADACKKYGIRLALYYSLWDRNWDARYGVNNTEVYSDYMINQLSDILDGTYGEVAELWLDGEWEKSPESWYTERIYDTVKRLQPGCQITHNWTIGGTSYIKPPNYKQGDPITYFPVDFRIADPWIPNINDPKLYSYKNELYYLPFETTVSLKTTWFYNTINDFEGPKQTPEMIRAMYTQLINQDNKLIVNAAPNKEGKHIQNDIDTLYQAARLLGIARGKALTADIIGSNLALNKTVTVSEEPYSPDYLGKLVVDGDSNTRWATGDTLNEKWIIINLGQNTTFNRIIVREATDQGLGLRINSYKLQYWNGTAFVSLNEGSTVGENLIISFNAVTSNQVKFICTSAGKGPTIREIEVFNVIKGQPLPPCTVRVEYRNENGYPVQTSEVLYGNLGASYTTQTKDLARLGYSFKQVIGSPTGVFSQQETVVTYIYKDLYGGQYYSRAYKATSGTSNNTTLQLNNAFVGSIGDTGGYVTIPVNAPSNGNYYLDIKYLCGDKDRPLKIAINGTPTGITYTAKQTTGWTQNDVGVLRVTVSLKAGINTIKLYNDNNLAGPWVGILRITLIFSPVTTTSTLPQGTYDTTLGTLSGGAAINSVNYTGWIGGPTDGASLVSINIQSSGNYNIAVKYIGPDINRPLKIDVNGINTGTIYSLPPTAGWTINDALVFTIPVTLNAGNNTIKFHGDGTNYSQNLGVFTISTQMPSPIASYNITKVFNGTTDYLDITRDLSKVQNLTSGAIVVKFKSTSATAGQSLLTMSDSTNASTYLSLMLSTGTTTGRLRYETRQNGTQTFGYNTTVVVNDGNVHTALISVGSRGIEGYIDGVNVYSVATSTIFFSNITGENTLNIGRLLNNTATGQMYFNGTIEYVDIYSNELTVTQAQSISLNSYKVIPVLPANTYNTLAGTLSGGSTIDGSTSFTGLIGGLTDGSSTVTVNVASLGSYNLAIKYIGPTTSRPLKVDVNGVNTGTIYSLPPTAGWTVNDALSFTIPVTLNSGNNTVKFHGDGTNYSQNLGTFTVTKIN